MKFHKPKNFFLTLCRRVVFFQKSLKRNVGILSVFGKMARQSFFSLIGYMNIFASSGKQIVDDLKIRREIEMKEAYQEMFQVLTSLRIDTPR